MLQVLTILSVLTSVSACTEGDVPEWFCPQVCPCCSGSSALLSQQLDIKANGKASLPFPVLPPDGVRYRTASNSTNVPAKTGMSKAQILEAGLKGIKGAKMVDRWEQDGPLFNVMKPIVKPKMSRSQEALVKPISLYDVWDDDFHKGMLDEVSVAYTLQEFMAEKYPDYLDDVEQKRHGEGWSDPQVAIWLYTTEDPSVYRPMNKIMREAETLDDIDAFWQSYIGHLKYGLENFAPYSTQDTYRGIGHCSSLDVLHKGDEGVLASFTSTSSSRAEAELFANGCTVLHYTGGGYDISGYSDFPDEGELLMEEGRVYNIVSAEKKCNEDGECFSEVACDTNGPNHGIAGNAVAEAEPVSQADICTAIDEDYLGSWCPYCACCGVAPKPVTESDNDCCSCCSPVGSCAGDTCNMPDGSLEYCNKAAQAQRELFFKCDSATELTDPRGEKGWLMFAGSFVGVTLSVSLVFVARQCASRDGTLSRSTDTEQPYLLIE